MIKYMITESWRVMEHEVDNDTPHQKKQKKTVLSADGIYRSSWQQSESKENWRIQKNTWTLPKNWKKLWEK